MTPLPGRVPVLPGPTPLQEWATLGAQLPGEGPVLAKRDDLTGVLLGGNKVRKLELLLHDAQQQGADVVVTYGALQSNHCALTAALAGRIGARAVLCLRGRRPERPTGNVLLEQLAGAEQRFDAGPHSPADRTAWLAAVADELRAAGARPYVVPYGGSSPLGALGYALAGQELQAQLDAARLEPAFVAVTSSSGGTQAGLVLARALGWLRVPVVGISVDLPSDELSETVLDLAGQAAALVDAPPPERSLVDVRDEHRGGGYAVPSPEADAAATQLLRAEGVLTDPTYTAKGLAGYLAVRAASSPDRPSVFLHTGGAAALFA
ncbi:MAG: 1-aminocyclopropane-1-carboxylate deaminase/D-cysteine desulfhydrase [Motilibacteraceae bacterium]